MDLKDVFKKAAEIGDFPTVEISTPIRNHPNMKGKIKQIRPDGVAVNLGASWDKWFHLKDGDDKRSKYMSELKFVD